MIGPCYQILRLYCSDKTFLLLSLMTGFGSVLLLGYPRPWSIWAGLVFIIFLIIYGLIALTGYVRGTNSKAFSYKAPLNLFFAISCLSMFLVFGMKFVGFMDYRASWPIVFNYLIFPLWGFHLGALLKINLAYGAISIYPNHQKYHRFVACLLVLIPLIVLSAAQFGLIIFITVFFIALGWMGSIWTFWTAVLGYTCGVGILFGYVIPQKIDLEINLPQFFVMIWLVSFLLNENRSEPSYSFISFQRRAKQAAFFDILWDILNLQFKKQRTFVAVAPEQDVKRALRWEFLYPLRCPHVLLCVASVILVGIYDHLHVRSISFFHVFLSTVVPVLLMVYKSQREHRKFLVAEFLKPIEAQDFWRDYERGTLLKALQLYAGFFFWLIIVPLAVYRLKLLTVLSASLFVQFVIGLLLLVILFCAVRYFAREEFMVEEKLPIREALGFGWETVKSNFGFLFVIFSLIIFIQAFPQIVSILLVKKYSFVVPVANFLSDILIVWLGIGTVRIALDFCDNKKPRVRDLFDFSFLFFRSMWAWILYAFAVIGGLVLFIVPGIIMILRLGFFQYLIVDKNLRALDALKMNFVMTRGLTWNLLGFWFILGFLNLLGLLCFIVGLVWTVPVTWLAMAFVYRKLSPAAQTSNDLFKEKGLL